MTITAVIYEAEEGGYWAEVPSLPGCMTEGETIEGVKASLAEAVAGWLEAARDVARVKGSHHIYKKPGVNALIVVPVHSGLPLKRGLFASLLTQTGLRWP